MRWVTSGTVARRKAAHGNPCARTPVDVSPEYLAERTRTRRFTGQPLASTCDGKESW
jgi:hypothetical protein